MSQAINKIVESEESKFSKEIISKFDNFLTPYQLILESKKSDRLWAGILKCMTKRELGEKFSWPTHCDNKAVLTTILYPGEFTHPILLTPPLQSWHLKLPTDDINREFDDILRRVHVVHYKPHISMWDSHLEYVFYF